MKTRKVGTGTDSRLCATCGEDISGRRPQARTCSAACRKALSRLNETVTSSSAGRSRSHTTEEVASYIAAVRDHHDTVRGASVMAMMGIKTAKTAEKMHRAMNRYVNTFRQWVPDEWLDRFAAGTEACELALRRVNATSGASGGKTGTGSPKT